MKNKCFIFAWGSDISPNYNTAIGSSFLMPTSGDLVIAADSGCEILRAFGIVPNYVIGDMDSFTAARAKEMFPNTELIVFPPEKDFTDTKLCLDFAIEKGCDDIVIMGGLGGRIDHTLANINLLRYAAKRNISLSINDGKNRAKYIKDSSLKLKKCPRFRYLSIVPFSDVLEGVSICGVKYPLNNVRVSRDDAITISNEITDDFAEITVTYGEAIIVESTD